MPENTPGRNAVMRSYAVAAFALRLALPSAAHAQTFPTHPITMIVPVSAGGAMDTIARIVGQGMGTALGQPVVIENVTGASGSIGVGRVARAAPDGYTLSYAAFATHVVSPATMSLSYDVLGDFAPIALISATPWLIAVKKDLPVSDIRGLIGWLKQNPDKASLGTAGVGSPSHIAAVLLQNLTGTRFQLVPYRGTAPAAQDLVAGQIDMSILDPVTCLPQLRAGRIKVLAVMAKSRTANAADVPTVDEAGSPGLYIAPWQAIWAPKGTPKELITKLNAAVVKTLADPPVRAKLAEQSYEVGPPSEQTPEYLGAFHKAETEKWWPIIKAAGIEGG
jgi:tripartite-type tricarboxylate transporter receptor subunit TctC